MTSSVSNELRIRRLAYTQVSRENRVRKLKELKEKPCTDCGVTYEYYVMQFDHVRGLKSVYFNRQGVKNIMKEIENCDLVCANCHFKREHYRRQYLKGVFD